MRRFRILILILFTIVFSVQWMQAGKKPKFTKFDAPGAGTGAGQGTFPSGINNQGTIGWYVDTNNVNHGFLRTPDGTITTFDAPGAGTGAGQGTMPQGMNPERVITGQYFDSGNVLHGFVLVAFGA